MGNTFEVKNTGEVKLKSFSSDPTGSEGELIYNSTDKKLKYNDGSSWNQAGGANLDLTYTQVCSIGNLIDRTSEPENKYIGETLLSSTDYINSTCFKKQGVAFCEIMDLCDDSSVDSTIWVSSGSTSATETGTGTEGYLELKVGAPSYGTASSTCIANQTNAFDFKSGDNEVIVEFEFRRLSNQAATSGTMSLQLTDGTNSVNIKTMTVNGGAASYTYTYYDRATWRLVTNVSGTNMYAYEGLETTTPTSTIDLSSLTGSNWWLKLYVYSSDSTSGAVDESRIRLYGVGYADGTSGSNVWQSTAQTLGASSTSAFTYLNTVGSLTNQLSLDNGSNFVSGANKTSITASVAGSQAILKTTGSFPTTINVGSGDRNITTINGKMQLIYR